MGHQTDEGLGGTLTTPHRLLVRDMLAIEHCPLHLYKRLSCHYFRTRNIVTNTSFACLFVLFASRCDPSQTVTPFNNHYRSGVWDIYAKYMTAQQATTAINA